MVCFFFKIRFFFHREADRKGNVSLALPGLRETRLNDFLASGAIACIFMAVAPDSTEHGLQGRYSILRGCLIIGSRFLPLGPPSFSNKEHPTQLLIKSARTKVQILPPLTFIFTFHGLPTHKHKKI